ncbi:VanZ family protein [Nocardioides gilvus]|uniref:VanZ family protein n=1 Tax=Nocardioides gilvus TaxID=1735589 RepID=UPI0013A5769C|nr:VanZ family protein [Nocardioides gilvus]
MTTPWTALARFALLVHIIFLAWVLFNPTPDVAIGTVGGVADRLAALGVPERLIAGGRVEFVLNALMFAPLPFLGALAFPRLRWSDWVAWTFIGSAGVEITQGLFLSGRSAQFVDVVANTLGGLLGAVCALIVGVVLRRARDQDAFEKSGA